MSYISETNALSNQSKASTGAKYFGTGMATKDNPNAKPTMLNYLLYGAGFLLVGYFIYKKVK